MSKEFTRQFQVRWSEVGPTNRVQAYKFMEYLVETAYDWGAANELGFEESKALGLIWLILETDIHFLKPLRYGDVFDFSIWLVEWRKIRGTRCFELRLKDTGEVIAQGTQQLVSLDAKNLRPRAVPEGLMDNFQLDMPRTFPFQRLPKLGNSMNECLAFKRKVEWGELDSYNHLNNGEAIRYTDELIIQFLNSLGWSPENFFAQGMVPFPKRVHIKYLEPGLWDDLLSFKTYPIVINQKEVISVIRIDRDSDSKEILQAHYYWGMVDLHSDKELPIPQDLFDSIEAQINASVE